MNNLLNKKKVIVFDIDGVILDSIDLVRQDLLFRKPSMTEEEFKEIFLENFWTGLTKFKEKFAIKELSQEERNEREAQRLLVRHEIKIFEGMKETLKKLSEKYILVVNSSGYKEHIEIPLRVSGVLRFFNFVASKEVSTDKIEKFKFILDKYDVVPKDVLFVTDTIGDIRDSDRSGIDSIAVTWGVHNRSDFTKQKFERLIGIIDQVYDIEKIVDSHFSLE